MIEKYHGDLVSIIEREKLGLLSKDYIRDTVNLILKKISMPTDIGYARGCTPFLRYESIALNIHILPSFYPSCISMEDLEMNGEGMNLVLYEYLYAFGLEFLEYDSAKELEQEMNEYMKERGKWKASVFYSDTDDDLFHELLMESNEYFNIEDVINEIAERKEEIVEDFFNQTIDMNLFSLDINKNVNGAIAPDLNIPCEI